MAVSTATARPDGRTGAPTEIRVLPAPRTEPPHDGELAALGIVPPPPSAPLLPLDLPTGAQVQSRRRRRSMQGNLGRGSAVGVVAADPADPSRPPAGALAGPSKAPAPDGQGAPHGAAARHGDAQIRERAQIPDGQATGAPTRDVPTRESPGQESQAQEPQTREPQAQELQEREATAREATAREDAAREAAARLTRLAVRRLIATCVEILGGYRPVMQLRPFCSPERFETIAQRLLGRPASQRPGPSWRQPGSPAHSATHRFVTTHRAATTHRTATTHRGAPPPRTGRVHQSGPPDRVTVRRVQVCPVSEEVVEVVAVLCRRDKVWAMAVRLELFDDRWLCTHLELV